MGSKTELAADKKAKLRALFPGVFTETISKSGDVTEAIDFEKLKAEMGCLAEDLDDSVEKFGISWPGKKQCMALANGPAKGKLEFLPEKSVNFETTRNLFIEGNNLEVLKLLNESHGERVKMIFIDPPYNTRKHFLYEDDFSLPLKDYLHLSESSNEGFEDDNFRFDLGAGRFHTHWLNMMFPRLYLARQLLADDGVIFISIDDNEVSQLRGICDEIFGDENFVAHIIWQHSVQPKGYKQLYSVHHNHILCFRKSDAYRIRPVERTEADNRHYGNPDNDPKGAWRFGDVRNALYRPNLIYDLKTPLGKTISPPKNGWRWSRETLNRKIVQGEISFSKDETKIVRKIYLADQRGRAPETIWFSRDVGSTREAAKELKALFDGKQPFDTVKPTRLIKRMIEVAGLGAGDICLDFFAGSASTAHAVLKFSEAQFIVVQSPDPVDGKKPQGQAALEFELEYLSDIGAERLRRAIRELEGAQEPVASEEAHLGFRFLRYVDD